ncbi:DUF1007 family protein [Aureimonas phyllosphaerae]|uniref:ABC-type uncharacterized transport system substrate-binding protein n=1 Tax=Aureimonas phyllosphaerae TaxID=1166078 RepID=A0A7W6BXR9_9HYPH|nr:DUF1007 family protein [Aureimonas phyllosphaerae]MBB3935651.1 ABC-type uncharacterized transport system substrate-binding protein [Aureimonas phyllosphaerae]MBB3959659.1 ABC-type uncharacterized transport system substrate-binding protein [Aureimonas phyllosphaerae]SFF13443.1 ABC-type uncharacterized transport system, substrate-binding protein [Aureimonas phyllosphaerae]
MRRPIILAGTGVALLVATCGAASAHPHVFADSRMEIVGTSDGLLSSVRNIWRFDELFSSSVVVDFDKNGNGTLDDDEVQAVAETVRQSIAEWDFYTFVSIGNRDLKLKPPESIRGLFEKGQLLLFFEMKLEEAVDLKAQPVTFSVYDESYFVAFDFANETAFQLLDLPKTCTKSYTRPDPDEDASDWMNSVSMLKPGQSIPEDGVNFSQLLATRVDVSCKAG